MTSSSACSGWVCIEWADQVSGACTVCTVSAAPLAAASASVSSVNARVASAAAALFVSATTDTSQEMDA